MRSISCLLGLVKTDHLRIQWVLTMRLRFAVIAVLLLNFFLTFYHSRSTPPAQTYDEIIYASEARALARFGTDLSGQWRPWFFSPSDGWYAELTSTTWVPGFLLFPGSPIFASRFVSGILGSLLPVILGLLATRLFKERRLFLPVALVLSVNPWVFQFSRMSFDSLPSVVLYSTGLLSLLSFAGWKKLFSVPFFFWGFYQYQGHKPLLLPLVVLAVLFLIYESGSTYKLKQLSNTLRKLLPAVCVVVFVVALTLSYLVRLPTLSSAVRTSNFAIFDEDQIASSVNERRRVAFDSVFVPIFNNKLTEKLQVLTGGFIVSFEPFLLFVHGDSRTDLFAVLDYGMLHLTDIPLIILFFIYAFRKKQHQAGALFLLGLTLIGTLPNVLRSGEVWLTFRGAFVFIGLSLFAGLGLFFLVSLRQSFIKYSMVGLYVVVVVYYLHLYFLRYPVQQAGYEGFYYRVVASYAQRVGTKPLMIIPDRSDALLDYLVVYNNALAELSFDEMVQAKTTSATKTLGSLTIVPSCPDEWENVSQESVIAVDYRRNPCKPPAGALAQDSTSLELLSVVDSGTRFTIYNDALCSSFELPDYPAVKQNVFAVEDLSDEQFCRSFFTRR